VQIIGPDQQTMAAALEVRSARAELLAGNVANADTPGYSARDLNFDNAVSDLLDRQNGAAASGASLGHLVSDGARANLQFDRNDVDVNQQLGKALDNSLNYVATLKLYGDSIQRIVTAASGS
jgi:flagellar basal-body rod protein FlgB